MSYVNADEILPEDLVREIQKYVDGKVLYIPRKDENSLSWGEKNGTKDRLAKRNREIVSRYYSGVTAAELGIMYFLFTDVKDAVHSAPIELQLTIIL